MFEKLKYLNNPLYYENIHKHYLFFKKEIISKTKEKISKNYFKASLQSILEMLHYLFLHDISIFKESIKVVDKNCVKSFIYKLLIISISAQFASDELPHIDDTNHKKIVSTISEVFEIKEKDVENSIEENMNLFGNKKLYENLYTFFSEKLKREKDLEESITFSILLNQMINDCILKSKKLLNR